MPPKVNLKVIQDLPELKNDTSYMDWRKDVMVWKMVNHETDKKTIGWYVVFEPERQSPRVCAWN